MPAAFNISHDLNGQDFLKIICVFYNEESYCIYLNWDKVKSMRQNWSSLRTNYRGATCAVLTQSPCVETHTK